MRRRTRCAPDGESHLHPTATLERLGQMLKREVVNHYHCIARRKRRRGVLHVQNIDRPPSQLCRERQRNANERRVRQCFPDGDVGPTMRVTIDRLLLRYIKRVTIVSINFRERLDQIGGVSLISTQPGSDRVCVKPDMQPASASSVSTDYTDCYKPICVICG